jgi:cytochrome c
MKYLALFVLSVASIVATATAGIAQQWLLFAEAEQAAGRQIFNDHCAACHAEKRAYGPSLRGVVGRPAGSLVEFPYSNELKKSGLVWTEDNLRKWIADNAHMIPNTLMPHVSISDPAEQMYLIAYLKTLKAPKVR